MLQDNLKLNLSDKREEDNSNKVSNFFSSLFGNK